MAGSFTELTESRGDDWRRHVDDLVVQRYEGADERAERDGVFLDAFDLCTPVAVRVLERIGELLLGGTASISTRPPEVGREPAAARRLGADLAAPRAGRNRFTGQPLPPARITAMYPDGFTHGHLALYDIGEPRRCVAAWPLQVTTPPDAERQEPMLWAIAEAEVHERTFAADLNWRLLQFGQDQA
jgi:hypothetical protein